MAKSNNLTLRSEDQVGENETSLRLGKLLYEFLSPLLNTLNGKMDRRLVVNLYTLVGTIVTLRNRSMGLLLSELGAYFASGAHAPAGTKRISYLIHSLKWSSKDIEDFFWDQSQQYIDSILEQGRKIYALWDVSVLEKWESAKLEGLSPVRSSKAKRLQRPRPGYYNPPTKPTLVAGMHWLGIVLSGSDKPLQLSVMRWWSNLTKGQSNQRLQELMLLKDCLHQWGKEVIHVFDRGYCGSPWLGALLQADVRFIVRWTGDYKLIGDKAEAQKAWRLCIGKGSWEYREVWDALSQCYRRASVYATQVKHPDYPNQVLWLVVSRPGKKLKPWYLLTNEPVETAECAWQIVFGYARRWQIETVWRYCKSELGYESVRVYDWEARIKLLLIVTLAYGFLLYLCEQAAEELVTEILRRWCHRTGRKLREVKLPLYRLREALSHLWLEQRPPLRLIARQELTS